MSEKTGKRKMWIDTDAGVDDAYAILMALARPDVDVIGISTTHGNVDTEQVARNVLRILKVAGRLEIPVYMGSRTALLGSQGDSTHYHGLDGLGDVADPSPPDTGLLQQQHAVSALIDTLRDHDDVIVMALGPLTNLSLALRLEPGLGDRIKHCYIMGGAYSARGNCTLTTEFNFHTDPEAAQVVLTQLDCPKTLVCWELCVKHGLDWEWYKEFTSLDTTKCKFMSGIESKVIRLYYNPPDGAYQTADQIIMAVALEEKIIQRASDTWCTVEVQGQHTRGMLVVDWADSPQKTDRKMNVRIIKELDHQLYKDMLMSALRD